MKKSYLYISSPDEEKEEGIVDVTNERIRFRLEKVEKKIIEVKQIVILLLSFFLH